MTNLARFTINGSPSTAGGYDVAASGALSFQLETPTGTIQTVTFEVYNAADAASPRASKNAPSLTLVGATTGLKVNAATPTTAVTSTAPSSSWHSWIVRCSVNGGLNAKGKFDPDLVFERLVCMRSPNGRRKIVAGEGTQYAPGGWADAQNDDTEIIYPGTGDMVGPAGSVNGNVPSFASGTGKVLGDSKLPIADLGQIKPFGLALDGTTNDYTLLQAALTARAGKVLDLGGYTIKCNSPLSLPNGITLQNGTIDLSGCADNSLCITASGSLGTVYTLTANLAYGAKQFSVASTSGLAVGDWVLVESTKAWSSGVVVGEIARIKTIDSSTLATLETPARSAYNTADTAKVTKLVHSVAGVTIRNVKFIGGGAGHGHRLFQGAYTRDLTIQDCQSTGFENTHWDVWCAANVQFDNVQCREATLSSTAYGICIERGCRDVSVTNSAFSWMRHGVTIGGSGWVNRFIRVENSHADYMIDAGFDSHPAAQYVTFANNTVICRDETDAGNTDGITCQAADYVLEGNIVVRPYGTGIYAQNLVTGCETAPGGVIDDNEVIEPGGVGVYALNQGQTMRGLVLSNNRVTGAGRVAGSTAAIQVYALTGAIFNFSVNGNTVSEGQAGGITLRGTSNVDGNANLYDGACEGNAVHLSGTANNGDGLLLLVAKRVAVGNNNIAMTEADRFGINASSVVDCTINDNVLNLPSGSAAYCIQLTGTGSGNVIKGNRGLNGSIGLVVGSTNTACTIGINDWTSCTTPMNLSTGAGHKLETIEECSADKGNSDFTGQHYSEVTLLWNTPLSANRAFTPPSANVKRKFKVVRGAGATGAFTLTAFGKALAVSQWAEGVSDGTNYILTGSGSL